MKRTLLQTKEEIEAWLKEQEISGTYNIGEVENSSLNRGSNFIIDIQGDFVLNTKIYFLPVNFGIVSGLFTCMSSKLSTLEGCPLKVGRNFSCSNGRLVNLIGGPKQVGGYYLCEKNNLTSLQGAAIKVGGFICSHNQLSNLTGAPQKIKGTFNCSYNYLNSLQGSPQSVGGDFDCTGNDLTSLLGGPVVVGGTYNANHNELTSLVGAPKTVGEKIDITSNSLLNLENTIESVGEIIELEMVRKFILEKSYFPCALRMLLPYDISQHEAQELKKDYAEYADGEVLLSKEAVAQIQAPYREQKLLQQSLQFEKPNNEDKPSFKI